MATKPQVIRRTIPRGFNHSAREWMDEKTVEHRTGWWEAEQDGVVALAPTREKAEEFVRFILGQRGHRDRA